MHHLTPFEDSSSILTRPADLYAQLRSEGYIYLRSFIPLSRLRGLREQMAITLSDGGWIEKGSVGSWEIPPVEMEPGYKRVGYLEMYRRLYLLQALHELAHVHEVVDLFRAMFNEDIFVYPRMGFRFFRPGDLPIKAHQDYPSLKGDQEVYTAWIPLTDCAYSMGGIEIAPFSHHAGVLVNTQCRGDQRFNLENWACDTWVGGDVRAGDVIIFHSLVVHRASPNLSAYTRLSLDARYQRGSRRIHPLAFTVNEGLPSWEELYRNWRASTFKYYWSKLTLNLRPSVAELIQIAQDRTDCARARQATRLIESLRVAGVPVERAIQNS